MKRAIRPAGKKKRDKGLGYNPFLPAFALTYILVCANIQPVELTHEHRTSPF